MSDRWTDQFKLGDTVLVRATVAKVTELSVRTLERIEHDPPLVAFITGASQRQTGSIEREDYGGRCFATSGSKHVWLVRRGLKNAEEAVFPDDLERAPDSKVPVIAGDYDFPEWGKEVQRKEMEGYPRDAKGRWVKANWKDGKYVPV